MGYVYVKIFLGTPVHQGASLQTSLVTIVAERGRTSAHCTVATPWLMARKKAVTNGL